MGRRRILAFFAVAEDGLERLLANPLDGLDRGDAGCCKPPDACAHLQVFQHRQGRGLPVGPMGLYAQTTPVGLAESHVLTGLDRKL